MTVLRRYGVADSIEFPLIKRGVVDFAVAGDYTPAQSDVTIHIDAASASYAVNVLQATGSYGWSLQLLAASLTGKKISVVVVDAATKAVEDQMILIETYGSPLAQHPFDLSVATITLSQPALDAAALQIVNTVWATASRTLSSFGTLQGDIVNAVWATPSRTLSATSSGIRKNIALADFEFLMTDSTNHNPATGKTVSVTRSIDNGAFAAGTLSAVTEIGVGIYSVDFGAGDLNGRVITLRATAAGCDDLLVTIIPDTA